MDARSARLFFRISCACGWCTRTHLDLFEHSVVDGLLDCCLQRVRGQVDRHLLRRRNRRRGHGWRRGLGGSERHHDLFTLSTFVSVSFTNRSQHRKPHTETDTRTEHVLGQYEIAQGRPDLVLRSIVRSFAGRGACMRGDHTTSKRATRATAVDRITLAIVPRASSAHMACDQWCGLPRAAAAKPMRCGVIIYLHIPKTGGSSVTQFLLKHVISR